VVTAWTALLEAKDPRQIRTNRRLAEAREEINLEVEKQTHTPPKFSKDGKIAVLKINSKAQVHPVIATRWASISNFKSKEQPKSDSGYLGQPSKIQSSRNSHGSKLRLPPRQSQLFLPYCSMRTWSRPTSQYHRVT
jgi:hypothetical protein